MTTPEVDARDVGALALLSLPEMTPSRLARLIDTYGDPGAAVDAVLSGRGRVAFASDGRCTERVDGGVAGGVAERVAEQWADRLDLRASAALLTARGTRVWCDGAPDYPFEERFPDRPRVLVGEGDRPDALARPRVAIVGTRSATVHGLADAHALGAFLARARVTVVSGLAIGIDGAAHEGALDAGGTTIGVVATGLDIAYPRRHRTLHERVRRAGLVMGESPYGAGPAQGRFPVRNRIIAAVADIVVVIEATIKGGARITADHALRYGRPLFAMPGSRRNPAAAGCNALLADGAHPLLDFDDILVGLGMTAGARRGGGARAPRPEPPGAEARRVLDALGGEPATIDEVSVRTGLSPGAVAAAVGELTAHGHATLAEGLVWPT